MSVSTAPTLDEIEAEYLQAIATPPPPGMTPEEVIAFRETDNGKRLQGWLKDKFTKAKDARAKEVRQWDLNLAMFNGQQWSEYYVNGQNYGYLGTPRSLNRERQTINRIKPIVRTEQAKFISQKPGASVIPSTDEDDDILAAEAGEQAWVSVSTRRRLEEYWREAVFWMSITGNGIIKGVWDPDLLDTDSDLDGDIRYSSVSPYYFFVADLNIKDLQEQPFVIHAYTKSTEQLSLRYKAVLNGKELASSCKEVSIQEAAFAAPKAQQDPKTYDSNMLYEYWVKPGFCKYLPDGGVVTMVDDLIVEVIDTGLPYEHGEYPFIHLAHIETERFYRTSIIEDLIDLQKDYNRLRSQIAESRKKMGKPQLLSPKGAIVASKVTTEIGQIIEYKLGMQPPTPMALQNLPQYILQEVDLIKADFEDISGQHEVSKGQAPTGVTAATAIAYLQESDDSYLLPSFKNIEAAWGRIAKQTLMLLVQYWDTEHIVKIVGKEDAFSTELLSGADLRSATDVRIEPGSSLPQSKAARQAFIMDLMANGYVPPEEGLDMLEIGGTKRLLDQLKNDKRQAQRENIKFKRMTDMDIDGYEQQFDSAIAQAGLSDSVDPETGMPLKAPLMIPVHDFDNHEVHIAEHDRFRKSQAWETLSPKVQTLMESHVQMHKVMMQTKMLEQTLSQIPTDGTTPGVSGMMDDNGPADFSESGGMVPPEDPDAAPGAPSDAEPPMPLEA